MEGFLPESFEDEKEADGVNEEGLWRFRALDFPAFLQIFFAHFPHYEDFSYYRKLSSNIKIPAPIFIE